MHDVVVIGGGISGLTAAWGLMRLGHDVVVLEASGHAGGNIHSFVEDGFVLESGPYCFQGSNENVWKLVMELGMLGEVESSESVASNRYVFRDGRLMALPFSPAAFMKSKLLSFRGKVRLMSEPFVRNGARDEDTAWEFFVRRFGVEAATYLMGPFISGIYAGDPKLIGARAAFSKFHEFERQHGSMILGSMKYMMAKRRRMHKEGVSSRQGLFSFRRGLGELSDGIASRLGQRFRPNAPVDSLRSIPGGFRLSCNGDEIDARCVICAIPPPRASSLLGAIDSRFSLLLCEIPMAPVVLVHWSQSAPASFAPRGFGFLMPKLYDLRVLGTVFASQVFPGRAPSGEVLFSSFYGGMMDKGAVNLSDQEIESLVMREHGRIFGHTVEKPRLFRILRYQGAIPQLLPDHPDRVSRLRSVSSQAPGLFLAGNYLSGVGIDHAVGSGYAACQSTNEYLTTVARTPMEAVQA